MCYNSYIVKIVILVIILNITSSFQIKFLRKKELKNLIKKILRETIDFELKPRKHVSADSDQLNESKEYKKTIAEKSKLSENHQEAKAPGHQNKTFQILFWHTDLEPMPTIMKELSLEKRKCKFQNCIFTKNNHNQDLSIYDMILFYQQNLLYNPQKPLPSQRYPNQKYVLIALESPSNSKLSTNLKGFFNLTWTYRLDSDIVFPYVIVRNKKNNKVIGPKKVMHWRNFNRMRKTTKFVKSKLQHKYKAAAWLVSHCDTVNKREDFVKSLQKELDKYGHKIDIYGECGNLRCYDECFKKIQMYYYFYLAFENSNAEDYVTEKVLTAVENYAVPVVLGGANYTRFFPDGIYLDATILGAKELAMVMADLLRDKKAYQDMFRWHRYYTYHSPLARPDTDPLCKLCEYVNDERHWTETVWHNITDWFNRI